MLSVAMDTYMAVVNMGQNEVVRKLAAWAGILAGSDRRRRGFMG